MSESKDAWFHAYNTAQAKIHDLEEQLMQKQRQWSERDSEEDVTERLVRELCEDILSRMKQDTEKKSSWRGMSLKTLVQEAKKAFADYSADNRKLLTRILASAEERRLNIESLENQIHIMKNAAGKSGISAEQLFIEDEKEKEREAAIKKMDFKVREAAEEGRINVSVEDEDVFDDFEMDMIEASVGISESAKVTPKSIPKTESRKRADEVRKFTQKTKVYMEDLSEYHKELKQMDWELIEIIGSTGISAQKELIQALLTKNVEYKDSAIRTCIRKLFNMHLLVKESVSTPLKGALTLYRLDDKGKILYTDAFKKEPVRSEMERVISEHDSYAHGYGILEVAEILQAKPYMKSVRYMNRKHPIPLGEGSSFIPDILCVEINDCKSYIEYEIGNHNQTHFSAKCSKICKLDNYLNFIVPNENSMRKIQEQIVKWMLSKGHSIDRYTIRITTASNVKDNDLRKNAGWKVVYHPEKGIEPVVNF